MSRRLVSFLGTGKYEPTHYFLADTAEAVESRYVCCALTKLLEMDEVIILSTSEADAAHKSTLITEFENYHLKSPYFERIKSGKTEEEVWENFNILQGILRKLGADKIVLDITHGFRSQPFFAAAVISYVRNLQRADSPIDIQVLYGAFESQIDNRTPIWDLTAFTELLDWTTAIRQFTRTGDGLLLAALAENVGKQITAEHSARPSATGRRGPPTGSALRTFAKSLGTFSDALTTVRVSKLLLPDGNKSSATQMLAQSLETARGELSEYIPPLKFTLDEINETLLKPLEFSENHLSGETGKQVMANLARLYLNFGRYAEAATTLREGWVCLYSEEAGCRPGSGYCKDARETAEKRWQQENPKAVQDVADIRNDINHAGFRKDPKPAQTIRDQLNKLIEDFKNTKTPDLS